MSEPELKYLLIFTDFSNFWFFFSVHVDVGAKVDPKKRHSMEINGYRFEVIPKAKFKEQKAWNSSWVKDFSIADGATYLLGPLSENTSYLVRVASRNAAGYSNWAEVKEFTTLPKLPFIPSKAQSLTTSILSVCIVTLISIIAIFNLQEFFNPF